jgi:hypothetical protein
VRAANEEEFGVLIERNHGELSKMLIEEERCETIIAVRLSLGLSDQPGVSKCDHDVSEVV